MVDPDRSIASNARSVTDIFSAIPLKIKGMLSNDRFIPLLILALIFLFALFLRGYFAYDLSASNDWLMSGGSDSYYYDRLMTHAAETGEHLHWDYMLNYPDGARNPRPPFYTFSVAIPAVFSEGLFSSAADSLGFFLIWSTAFWGALTVIPTYLIARELFGRKTGYIAALFLAILPSHVERSVATLSDHDPFVLFFIVLTIYFLMKTMKAANNSRWVDNWLSFRSISSGLRTCAAQNRKAIIYSLLAGLSLYGIAVAWVGFAYVEVIILAFFMVQVLINKFKGIDSTTITLLFFIMFSFALLLASPVYYQMLMFNVRFDVPIFMFIAVVVFGMLFAVTRDYPWLITLPILGVLIATAMVIIMIIDPALGEALATGQGYFFKSKLYETIAEARAPKFSELAVSFGIVTFVLSFVGLFLMLFKIPKRVSGDFVLVSIWMTVAIFMAGSAGRFMFNAAPAFALSSAWATYLIINRLDFKRVAKLFRGSSGSIFQVVRKSVKVRHVLGALFLAFMLVLPNTWFAIDAGIPQETKSELDVQIYNSMPSFLRPDEYPGRLWYFGAFGYSLPLPSQYFPAYWDWFSQQDTEVLPESERPAYVSWWDYGFEAIHSGHHPAVADNFQQGYQIAGNILLSQSEEEAIGLFIARVVNTDIRDQGGEISPELSEILERYGASPADIMDVKKNTSKYRAIILDDPMKYGTSTSDISNINVLWRYLGIYFGDLGMENVVGLYHDLRDYSGYDIGYIGIDSRLIQKSARDPSVFYAPVKLTDRIIDGSGNPIEFYEIKAVDDMGIAYSLDDSNLLNAIIVDYKIEFREAFFQTTLYRAFSGISPSDLGNPNDGLPGYSGSSQSTETMPGYNMTHFIMIYRTAYFNPSPYGTATWRAVSFEEAVGYQEKISAGEMEALVDMSSRSLYTAGATMLRYYDGAILSGHISDTQGDPAPGIRVTVLDEYGIPHQSIISDSEGYYSIVLPPGNDTIVLSTGDLDPRSLTGADAINNFKIFVSEEQAMRETIDDDGNGILDWQISRDEVVSSGSIYGVVYFDSNGDNNFTQGSDVPIPTGTVTARNLDNNMSYSTDIQVGQYSLSVSPGHYEIDTIVHDVEIIAELVSDITPGSSSRRDIKRVPTEISGIVIYDNGEPVVGATVLIEGKTESAPLETSKLITDAFGNYAFELLLPGDYQITVTDSGDIHGAISRLVQTTVSQRNLTADFILRLTGVLDLEVVDKTGSPLEHASILITNAYDPSESLTLAVDSDGVSSTVLPDGYYSLTVRMPTVEGILVGGTSVEIPRLWNTYATITADTGKLVTGVVQSRSGAGVYAPEAGIDITFYSGQVSYFTATNRTGNFAIYLPEGSYEAVFYSNISNQITTAQLNVEDNVQMDIMLENAVLISGNVWHDQNESGQKDAGESVPYSFIRVALPNGVTLRERSDVFGNYEIVVPDEISMTLTAEAIGFEISIPETVVLSGDNIERDFKLDLAPIYFETVILFDDEPLPGITVELINASQTVTLITDLDGKISGYLTPMLYDIKILAPVSLGSNDYYYAYYPGVYGLLTFVGIDLFDLPPIITEKRYRVEGNILGIDPSEAADIKFRGPSVEALTAIGSYETYLAEGDYVVYALDSESKQKSVFSTLTVNKDALVHDIELVPSYELSGQIQFVAHHGNMTSIEIIDLASGGSITQDLSPNAFYTIYLPPGDYDLRYETHILESIGHYQRFIYLYNSTTVTMDSDVEIIPEFDADLDNSSFYASITDASGTPLQAEIFVRSNDEFGLSGSYMSDQNGIINSSIHPGYYAVYAFDEYTGLSYFGVLEVGFASPAFLDITLSKGYFVMVVASAQGSTELDFISVEVTNNDVYSRIDFGTIENENAMTLLLPEGNYAFDIKSRIFEVDLLIAYSAIVESEINSDMVLNVPLERDSRYIFIGDWDSSEKEAISPGESASYSITIENKGNIMDSYELSGTGDGFEFSFPETAIEADYRRPDNTVTFQVEITATSEAKVVHDQISISIKSIGDPSTTKEVVVEIDVLPVYSVEAAVDETGILDGQSYFSKIKVTNSGNVLDNYTFAVVNEEEMNINGWSLSAESSDGSSNRIQDIDPGASALINISFVANRINPNSDILATVIVISNSSSATSAMASTGPTLPDLSFDPADEIEVTGDNVYENDVFAEKTRTNIMLVIVLITMVASIFIVRKIKFGRFLK